MPDHISSPETLGFSPGSGFILKLSMTEVEGEIMDYDLKAMDSEIKAIEERTRRLKELGRGFEAVEKNADAILTFVYLLKKSVSYIIE